MLFILLGRASSSCSFLSKTSRIRSFRTSDLPLYLVGPGLDVASPALRVNMPFGSRSARGRDPSLCVQV